MNAWEISEINTFLETQTFKDNVYADVMNRGLLTEGYQFKIFCKPAYEKEAITISIYIGKQNKILVDIYLRDIINNPNFRSYIHHQINKRLDEVCHPAYELTMEALKSYNNNIKEETTMHKTQNEIEFENFANERRAQADASVQAYKDKVENEIETKRQECLEADKKERAYQAAAQYRYFFDGLLAAGFDENQAMAILLEKCQVTKIEMRG